MSGSGSVGPGVVERASKEISKRIHLLGFSRGASSSKKKGSQEEKQEQEQQKAADKLNGNDGTEEVSSKGSAATSSSSAASSVSKMGNIIKGSVMDKVTHVFNSSSMGNSNNKQDIPPSTINASGSLTSGTSSPATTSGGINIPKGAVANGRAKFEAAVTSQPQSASVPNEKPLRFFSSSRSRGNSPLLPVKTPKVPPAAINNGTQGSQASTISNGNDKDSSSTSLTPSLGKKLKASSNNSNGQASMSGSAQNKSQTFSMIPNSRLFPKMKRFVMWEELWNDPKFLNKFFHYFGPQERHILAQVCKIWKEILYQPIFWRDQRPVLHCRAIRNLNDNDPVQKNLKMNFFESLKVRGFETLVLFNANDSDVYDFVRTCTHASSSLNGLVLRCCNLSDRGLEALMEFLQSLYQLEIAGCNDITEQGLWSSLHPRLVSVTINDCINVADECICAVTQLLPSLYEFNLQAYHVTDSALNYFSPKQTGTLNILRLQSCWEITNHGVVNIVHTLPNLTVLSLSGCSKLTDDGVELIAENLRKLRSLDVSWCPRVTDAALEYIACDLNHLEELTLDRCVHITDIGIGYISTMLALNTLYLRWCTQIRDFGLQHICGMRSMQMLSLAGCPLLTSTGMSNLIQLRHLVELELTNCPGATMELIEYLRQNLPKALVLD